MLFQSDLKLEYGQYCSAGTKAVNEDCIGLRIPEGNLLATKGACAVIADGVSAAESGREASEAAVGNFLSDYYSTPESWSVKQSAHRVLIALNRWLYGLGQGYLDSNRGFITTFTAMIIKGQQAYVFHAGDSRLYRWRDGRLDQLTRDHTAIVSEHQRYLSRALGMDLSLDVDFFRLDVRTDDVYFLSTDGLHDFVGESRIAAAASAGDLQQAIASLAEHALDEGSDDNISGQFLKICKLGQQSVDDYFAQLTALPFPPPLNNSDKIDGFEIVREIHASNRSQLYIVKDIDSGDRMCMKTPSQNFSDDASYIERFILESWIGSRLSNSNVVSVIEHGRQKTALYYLTELVEGVSLAQWMKEHPQPPLGEACQLIGQIGRGLRAFHRKETLHQDIKPDNILIDKNGQVKIVDFGSCYIAGIAEMHTIDPLNRFAEHCMGTASYAAPESRLGRKVDHRSDLFSLAVVAFELLTGHLPFAGKLEHCHSSKDFMHLSYTPAYQLNPLVPVWLDGALKKALHIYPERRHQDISEFMHEINTPNNAYLRPATQSMLEQNPVRFWQCTSAVLAIALIASVLYILA